MLVGADGSLDDVNGFGDGREGVTTFESRGDVFLEVSTLNEKTPMVSEGVVDDFHNPTPKRAIKGKSEWTADKSTKLIINERL